VEQFLRYFCGDAADAGALDATEALRISFYKAVTLLARAYADVATHLTEAGYSDAEAAAYSAPYPDVSYKAGVRRFAQLVMVRGDMEGVDISRQAAAWWRNDWQGQSFMAVGAADPVLGPPVMELLRQQIKGCPEALVIPDGGHFVQEWGDVIAPAALRAFGDI
jgi:pimeloyl-ACP methyl ester carboxylesterase